MHRRFLHDYKNVFVHVMHTFLSVFYCLVIFSFFFVMVKKGMLIKNDLIH